MGNFINTANKEDVDHIGTSYAYVNESGLTIHLHYNYWTKKHKPSYTDTKFSLNVINKLLKKYNIKVAETHGDFGSDDTYIITYSRKMEKEAEKPKVKSMTKSKVKGNE